MKECPICNNSGIHFLESYAMDIVERKKIFYDMCPSCKIIYMINDVNSYNVDYSDSGYYQEKKPRLNKLIDIMMNGYMSVRLKLMQSCAGSLVDKTVLDIGCGKGRFLYCARKAKMKIMGVEPTKRSYIAARKILGDAVKHRAMELDTFPENYVDIITMWHVFEHIPDPLDMLNICKKVLKPKGCMVIAVPNYEGWVARIGGRSWFNLDPPRHLIHYNPSSLANILKDHGFIINNISHHYPELTYFSALQTMLNIMPISPNFLFNLLKRNKNAMPKSWLQFSYDLICTFLFGFVFILAGLLIVPIAEFVRKSDCITLVCHKAD